MKNGFFRRYGLKTIIIPALVYLFLLPGHGEKPMNFTRCPSCPEEKENSYKFALLDGRDRLVTFSELIRESNIIVAFWASYCAPCKKEIPQLVRLEKKYSKSGNLKLVLIDVEKEGKSKGLPALDELGVSTLCLFDIYQVALKKIRAGHENTGHLPCKQEGAGCFQVYW